MSTLNKAGLFYLSITATLLIGAPLFINHVEARLNGLEERMEQRYSEFPENTQTTATY